MATAYTADEAALLLKIARRALQQVVVDGHADGPSLAHLPPSLQEQRACFVTLHTRQGELRGCTGTLAARQPLADEVAQMMVQTALHDPRFMPVTADELPDLQVEISILTPSVPLEFGRPADIPDLLRPHVDGVTVVLGERRATFLPQVWERVPQPVGFLDLLCRKMGLSAGAWRHADVRVYTYQTVIIAEEL